MKPLRPVSLNKRYVYYFTPANVQLRLNRYGGCFDNGRPLPELQRERVLDLYHHDLVTAKSHGNFVRVLALCRK